MLTALLFAVSQRNVTDPSNFPDLPEHALGLPALTNEPCLGESCSKCVHSCPTGAISIDAETRVPSVSLDRGLCVTCGACIAGCPTGAIVSDRSTKTAVRRREDLVLSQAAYTDQPLNEPLPRAVTPFKSSVDIREVSTGCNATDLEVAAVSNPMFDCSRFGIHFVASPRHADALLVTGPVGRAMQEPLLRCYQAMAEPRLVIAAGAGAISGGVHRGGYAEANGVMPHLHVDAFIPGSPPHPWSIIHGILLATGSRAV